MDNILRTWFVVVNPHAGSGRSGAEWEMIKKLLNDKGIEHEYRMTDCKYHATELVFRAAREGYRRFIAVGGDGTIHEVLDGIMLCKESYMATEGSKPLSLSDFTLAVIPVGSGNDWIRAHHIPDDIGSVADLIVSESFAAQDIIKVTTGSGNSYMINIGGVGFDARVCERVNMKKDMGKRGRLIYLWSLLQTFFRYRSPGMEVCLDGRKVWFSACFSVAIGIGQYSGGGMRQTPDAVTDDGLADVTVIPRLPFPKVAKELHRLFDGTFTKVKELVTGRCRILTVRPAGDRAELVEVDGEIVGRIPAKFEILPDKINVLHRFQ